MSGQFKTELTRGTFDPRTYKTVDKDNWARERMPTTGQIHFVRERQVPVVTPPKEEDVMPESRAVTPTKEVKAPAPAVTSVKKAEVQWAGRRRSDITREGGASGYFGRTV